MSSTATTGTGASCYLKHKYQGVELKLDYARDTLANLQRLWGRPVYIETVVDDKPTVDVVRRLAARNETRNKPSDRTIE